MRLKSETFLSSYRQKMTWKSFSGRFESVVLKFTISNNKLLKLCNY